MSREYSNFSLPVCTSFKRRLLDGQLCYQIDVNTIINETTAAGLQTGGLALLVDANAEYDLISLRMTPEEEVFDDFTEEFFEAEESEKIMIHIETISKTISNFIDPSSTSQDQSVKSHMIWTHFLVLHRLKTNYPKIPALSSRKRLDLTTSYVDPVPLKLFGEGNYAITDIKEVKVTEEFLGLDTAIRGCHRNSELEHCETKTYIEKAKRHCHCIPSHLRRIFPDQKVSSKNCCLL